MSYPSSGIQSPSLALDQYSGRGMRQQSIYQQLGELSLTREIKKDLSRQHQKEESTMRGRGPSRSPAKAPPVRNSSRSSRHGPTQQLSKSLTNWLSGDGRNQRTEPSPGSDRRSRATQRDRDTGRGRRRSVSTASETSLVSRSRSRGHRSSRRAHSPVSTELGSRSSYSSSSSHRKSRASHHHRQQHRRDRSYSTSRSRSSSRERTKHEKKKALKTGLLLLGSVAAATAAAQKFWPNGATHSERNDWEADRRDNRSGHHRRRTSRERVRDPSNRERLSLKEGAGVKTTPALPAPTSVASTSMRTEPPRSVYHPHYEETQYAAAPEDDEAIWMPVEESISRNSRGEVVVETIERRVAPPSEVASKRKSHRGRRLGEDSDAFREVERYKIVDEWDPRWKKY